MSYYESPSNRLFGYGLLSRIDTSAGSVLGYLTLGGPDYDSRFFTLVINDGVAACAGYTKYVIPGDSYQGWLVEVDLTGW
jgi:hypothetical protein